MARLYVTTALALVLTGSAFAADNSANKAVSENPTIFKQDAKPIQDANGYFQAAPDVVLATSLISKRVYASSAEDAAVVGDINDIVMSPNGAAEAVVIGVGGFLGIGEKNVAVDFDRLSWVKRDNDNWVVISATKEELQQAPAFDMTTLTTLPATETQAAAPATDPVATPNANDTAAAPVAPAVPDNTAAVPAPDAQTTAAIDRANATKLDLNSVGAKDLIGATVYGANDTTIGEISDVRVTADNKVEAYIIDVGGFLGMGEKPVAIDASKFDVLKNASGSTWVATAYTKEQLEAQPAFTEDAWNTSRDTIILK